MWPAVKPDTALKSTYHESDILDLMETVGKGKSLILQLGIDRLYTNLQ